MHGRSLRQTLGAIKEVALLRARRVPRPPIAPDLGRSGVFIGAANSAGQGWAWARALERARPEVRAVSASLGDESGASGFSFPADQLIYSHYAAHSAAWQRGQFRVLQGYRAALIESGTPILSRLFDGDTVEQARALSARGVQLAFLFHGSDIRDPDAHLESEHYSHFHADEEFTQTLRQLTSSNRQLIRELKAPVFVSTPDLLTEVEDAIWLPVVVDVERWRTERNLIREGEPLRVAYAPSSSLVKGTELVRPTFEALAAEGVITYQSIEQVPHAEMPKIYGAADVVVDQFRVGNYGVAACEAMAAGRIVVSHVSERVRRATFDLTGEHLPIVEATADTLGDVLKDIAVRPQDYLDFAAVGPGFVERHHDGRRSGEVLARWLDS